MVHEINFRRFGFRDTTMTFGKPPNSWCLMIFMVSNDHKFNECWWKEFHLHHPPVITVFFVVSMFTIPMGGGMGGLWQCCSYTLIKHESKMNPYLVANYPRIVSGLVQPWWFQWDFCGGKSSTNITGVRTNPPTRFVIWTTKYINQTWITDESHRNIRFFSHSVPIQSAFCPVEPKVMGLPPWLSSIFMVCSIK